MFEQIDQLIANREDEHPANLLKARELLLEASEDDDQSGGITTRLAEVCFWLGEYADDDKDKGTYHEEGVGHGKIAVEKAPKDPAAHLWYAANMGSHGVVRGIMSSLFYMKPIENHGKKALELDETFFYGAPLRLMGRYYHQAPGWPIGAGDTTKAMKTLERAVEVGPEFLLNHLYLAEVYIEKRKKDQAKAILTEIIDRKDPQPFPMYQNKLKEQAKKLRRKL